MLILLFTFVFAQEPAVTPDPNQVHAELVTEPNTDVISKAEVIANEAQPTIRYLVEELKNAVEKGLPLASESITVLSTQISYYGIGSLAFDIFWLFLSIIGMFQAKKLWLYAATKANGRGEAIEYVWSFLLFIVSTIFLITIFSTISEDIMMATAPLIWAIQQI